MKKFTKLTFEDDAPRFVPYPNDNYAVFDIVDTKKMVYLDFIEPYTDIYECERDCNILNVVAYLFKEIKGE